jgi:hypothetical protein
MNSAAQDHAAVRALRTARKRKRLVSLEWFELAYKVYVVGLLVIVAVALLANLVGDGHLSPAQVADVTEFAPSILGAVMALAIALGLRSGARGGPISVEQADVQYLLLAPVSRRAVLSRPAVQQLRLATFAGAAVGAVGGQLLGRRLNRALIPWTLSCAAAGATIGLAFVAAALLAHTLRVRRWQATLLGAALLGWQVASIPSTSRVPGPLSTVGSLVLWPIRVHAVDLVLPAVVFIATALALAGLERLSIDALSRRSALVTQLRFAVTMRDLRTVVLLRRQLSNEQHRTKPWFRTPRLLRKPVTRRGMQSIARFPLSRVIRMVLLAAIAAAAQVVAFRGTTPMVVVSGLAAFVLGLECVEPFAQEIDQPERCDALPQQRGWLLVRHLPVPAAVAAVFGVLGAAGVYAFHRTEQSWHLALLLFLPVVWAGAAGAVLNVMSALPEPIAVSTSSDLLPPEIAGMHELFRTAWPLAVAVSGSLPVLAARSAVRHGNQPVPPALQAIVAVALVIAGVAWWARKRDDVKSKASALWAAGDAEFKSRHSRAGGSR